MTTIATLRVDRTSTTRIVRREVEVSLRMSLDMVARTLRAACSLAGDKRRGELRIGEHTYGVGEGKRRQGVKAASGRSLGSVLGEATAIAFMHNLSEKREVVADVVAIRETEQPEAAFPALTAAIGTIAFTDLTADDYGHQDVVDADDPCSWRHEHAVEMAQDEEKRAIIDKASSKSAVDSLRLSRRGPLRSHQPGSARNTGLGLAPEPDTKAERWAASTPDKPVVVTIGPGTQKPKAAIVGGVALIADHPYTREERDEAHSWYKALTDEEPIAMRDAAAHLAKLARRAPADIWTIATYGRALEAKAQWRAAIDVYTHAVGLGTDALPKGFKGALRLRSSNENGLISAAEGLGRCECEHGSRTRGIKAYEAALTWDPAPDSEARGRLGSEYLHAGKLRQARAIIESYPGLHAPYLYDLYLCALIEGNLIEAVTAARRAVAAGLDIAERLLGHAKPLPIPMGSLQGGRSRSEAGFYTRQYSWTWRRYKQTRAVLR